MNVAPIVIKHQISDFCLAKTVYPAKFSQSRHLHESASISFLMAGSYAEYFERQNQIRQPQTLVVRPAGGFHSVEYCRHQPVQILNLQMDSAFVSRFSSLAKVLDSSNSWRSENIVWLGNRLARELSQIDEFSALAIEAIALELLVEISRQSSTNDEFKSSAWLNRAKDFLHDNFSETVGLEEVARAVGVHPVHLARVFRRQFGYTMGEYVRRLRLEFAKREISATNKPLCEIALSAGFSDQSHLNKTFKNLVGITPYQYRRMSRQS